VALARGNWWLCDGSDKNQGTKAESWAS